jgi:hypothetical protein
MLFQPQICWHFRADGWQQHVIILLQQRELLILYARTHDVARSRALVMLKPMYASSA